MSLIDLYHRQFVISFEIFPPKTPAGEEKLFSEMTILAAYRPGYVSVTYGAGGSTREKTLAIALGLKDRLGLIPLVHFTCVGAGRGEISSYLHEVRSHGIENILALRGDPPVGETGFTPHPDGFRYANELVSYIRGIERFTIAVAGYPEGHIEATSLDTDLDNLKRKVDAGADLIITQLFYQNEFFYRFMDRLHAAGITIPVIPGIMPVTNTAQIHKITTMCGATLPRELEETLCQCSDADTLCEKGIEYSIRQCRELRQWGVAGFHFYTLNKATAVSRIIDALGI